MDQFVHAQNLIRFIDLLEHETDPAKRERFRELLVEEENRFGTQRERVLEADGLITGARGRVTRQREILSVLVREHRDASAAQALLTTMEHTLALLMRYREVLDSPSARDDPLIL